MLRKRSTRGSHAAGAFHISLMLTVSIGGHNYFMQRSTKRAIVS